MRIPDFVITHVPIPEEIIQISDHIFGISKNIEEMRRSEAEGGKKILIFSGLSGSGKDTIVDRVMGDAKKFKKVKTCTTRLRRGEESETDDPYVRITEEQLQTMMKDGSALECVEYAGNYYCSSVNEIQKVLNEDKTPLLRVDPQGAKFFLAARENGHRFLKDFTFVYVFIVPTSFQDLRERLVNRGSSPELVNERIEQSRKDITHIGSTQYIVVNEFGQLDTVIDELSAIL